MGAMSGRKGKKRDVFQRIADTLFLGNRALAQTLFWIGLFTVPYLSIGVLVLFSIFTPPDPRPEPKQPARPAPRPAPKPKYQDYYATANEPVTQSDETPAPAWRQERFAQPVRPARQAPQPAPAPKPRPAAPRRPAAPQTGNAEADAVIRACHQFKYDAEETLPEIDDLAVRARAQQTIAQVEGIKGWLVSQPETAKGAQRLADYYLPTTLKLLRTYISVDNNPGPNAQNICREIDRTLEKFNDALATLQNDLLDSTALDVAAEIRAMESMLGSEGLVSEFRLQTPGEDKP